MKPRFTIENALTQLSEACWIGEDGDAAVAAKTKREALRLFKQLMSADVGRFEAREMKASDIGIGFVGLLTDDEIKAKGYDDPDYFRREESFWYVSWAEDAKGPKVYIFHQN